MAADEPERQIENEAGDCASVDWKARHVVSSMKIPSHETLEIQKRLKS
jgi:hypothetical protein